MVFGKAVVESINWKEAQPRFALFRQSRCFQYIYLAPLSIASRLRNASEREEQKRWWR